MKSAARYDPVTLRILGARTAYEEFHEFAHLEQDMRQTLAWRCRHAFTERPRLRYTGLGGMARLGCELEAAWLARNDMRLCGVWDASARWEALCGLWSYAAQTLFHWIK